MSTIDSGEKFHLLAEKAREEDKHEAALQFLDKAEKSYQKEQNFEGQTKVFQSKNLVYKHLFLLTAKEACRKMALKNAQKSLETALEHNLTHLVGSCYFHIAQGYMLFDNFTEAIKNYKLALDNYQGSTTQHGDYVYHLGEALYRNGQKIAGKQKILAGLTEIKNHMDEVGYFEAHVWLSGAYMRLAELVAVDKPKEAKQYLQQGEEVIKSYEKKYSNGPFLVIRKRQYLKLKQKFQ